MLSNGGLRLPKPPLQIKEGDKFYRRLLSKESSLAQHSFRVYYGVAPGAVPFQWESQPGTPKHPSAAAAASADLRPPLTPPPSYYYSKSRSSSKKQSSAKSGLIRIFLPRLSSLRKSTTLSWSSSSSSSCSISNGAASLSWSSSCSYRTDEDECSSLDDGSPTSILCLGGCGGRLRGYFSAAARS